MKNIIAKLMMCFAAVLLSTGCSKDFLNTPLEGRLSTAVFPADQAVVGCYSVFLSADKDWSLWEIWPVYLIGNTTSDDAWKGGNSDGDQPDLGSMERFETLPSNGISSSFYSTYYHYIFAFNTTLEGLNKSTDITDSLKNRYIGEVRFLRAFAYSRLMMAYGSKSANLGLVINDHPLLPNEIGKIPRSNYQETWDFIINDLKFGEDHLPAKEDYPTKDLGRATKGAAQAMIARAYMYEGDWVNCEAYAQKVISSNSYQLEPQFPDVFSKSNKNGKESIFELAYTIDTYFGKGYDFSHGSWWATAQQPQPEGWGCGALTKDLLNEFSQNPGDPRIVWTFLFAGDVDVSTPGDSSVLDFNVGLDPDKLHLRKVWDPKYFLTGNGQTDYNLWVIRYADVLLMYAEAANENGKTTQALAALNQIRKRARQSGFTDPYRLVKGYNFPANMPVDTRVPDETTTDQVQLRNAIWHERRVELAGEGYRFFDIVRQGRAGTILRNFAQNFNTLKGKAFQDNKSESLPIPQNEMQASAGIIKQNPGY